jgi:hypothetical protein
MRYDPAMDRWRWSVVVFSLACGPAVAVPGSEEGTSESSDGDATTGGTTMPSTTAPGTVGTSTVGDTTASSDPTATVGDDDDDTAGATFIQRFDWGSDVDCDPWLQDCPPGSKCAAWANDGGSSWNATRCVQVDPTPAAVGEPCTVAGGVASGIDDCELGAMCFFADDDGENGECIALCVGSPDQPACAQECSTCVLGDDSVLALCLENCDPVAQACGEGKGCYPGVDSFQCLSFVPMNAGPGAPCEFVNVCDPGNACLDASRFPSCEGNGCCAPFCDLSLPDTCDAIVPGTTCVPWFDEPPEACANPDVGTCSLPM